MSAATGRLAGLVGRVWPRDVSCFRATSLYPFGGRDMGGLTRRPRLVDPDALEVELVTQVQVNKDQFTKNTGLWKWQPHYRRLPPVRWQPSAQAFLAWVPVRRLVRKTSFLAAAGAPAHHGQ